MRVLRLLLCVLFFSGTGLTGLQAQESVNVSGSTVLGNNGSVSYSVGQVFFQSFSGNEGSVEEGVQQPFEIFVIPGVEDTSDINLLVTAYPNPTADYLTLSFGNIGFSDLSYQLVDLNGKLIKTEKITENFKNIAMGHLVSETYFVKVIQGNKKLKTCKIIEK